MTYAKTSRAEALFDLHDRVAIVTGGAGLLRLPSWRDSGRRGMRVSCCWTLASADPRSPGQAACRRIRIRLTWVACDITREASVDDAKKQILEKFGRIDILINNAANNPMVEDATVAWSRLENFPLEDLGGRHPRWTDRGISLQSHLWDGNGGAQDRASSSTLLRTWPLLRLTSVFIASKGLPENQQPVKPVTYSVVKTGLLGLTRYLATYWSRSNIRVNAISPGGVFNDQPEVFLSRIKQLIPMGRMANRDEYQGAILFLCSDASSYMTGTNLVIDGGRSCL